MHMRLLPLDKVYRLGLPISIMSRRCSSSGWRLVRIDFVSGETTRRGVVVDEAGPGRDGRLIYFKLSLKDKGRRSFVVENAGK